MTIWLPLITTGVIYGVAVPQYDVPPGHYYTYHHNDAYCGQSEGLWVMVWDGSGGRGLPGQTCNDGRPLLLLNEPEQPDQANLTPAQAAAIVEGWGHWTGPVYCCGNLHGDRGWQWFGELMAVYSGTLPIDGLHIHVYTTGPQANAGQMQRWRQLADSNGWTIAVTEAGRYPTASVTPATIAQQLPSILDSIRVGLRPEIVFWYALRVIPANDGGGLWWTRAALTDDSRQLTSVGQAWERYIIPAH